MLRVVTLMSFAMVSCALAATSPAVAADQLVPPHVKRHARANLPPGLPRPHYKYRTTVVYETAPPVVAVEPEPEELISSWLGTPLLPGSSTLPGYYGRAFSYDYQGPYYGSAPYPSYFNRLPYACGVYGYC